MSRRVPLADLLPLVNLHERLAAVAQGCASELGSDRYGDEVAPELLAELYDALRVELRATQAVHMRVGRVIRAIATAERVHLTVDDRLNERSAVRSTSE